MDDINIELFRSEWKKVEDKINAVIAFITKDDTGSIGNLRMCEKGIEIDMYWKYSEELMFFEWDKITNPIEYFAEEFDDIIRECEWYRNKHKQ